MARRKAWIGITIIVQVLFREPTDHENTNLSTSDTMPARVGVYQRISMPSNSLPP